ncbi:MAG: hypothetical protein H6Q17_2046 [Bacteroidetes bacterium]|nr:hypothetical protein [Bacteroidota bacterium]
MKEKVITPEFNKSAFHCPWCGVFAQQSFQITFFIQNGNYRRNEELFICSCSHCCQYSYWYKGKLIIPTTGAIELPNEDLPENVLELYNEAKDIINQSPRGAAALLRLALQLLCKHLGGEGKNINDDIAKLVSEGLPVLIQQSLDIVRVVGNNAVHPGTIDIADNYDLAATLFSLINIIADDRITKPKQVQTVYQSLPSNLIAAIEKRDSK